ncbi:MAG: rhodanese-like domain-containing protein [Acidimicrobiia bacterium]
MRVPTTTIPQAAIDSATLAEWLVAGTKCRLVDVRSPAEYEAAHIPGSFNVPLEVLSGRAGELQPHMTVPTVLVCRSGQRAGQAATLLAATGAEGHRVLTGGMQAWDDGARQVNRGRQRWALERQIRLVAGLLVLTGIIGSLFVPAMKFLAGFVGAGLTFAALSNTCMMGGLLSRLPYNRAKSWDVESGMDELLASAKP